MGRMAHKHHHQHHLNSKCTYLLATTCQDIFFEDAPYHINSLLSIIFQSFSCIRKHLHLQYIPFSCPIPISRFTPVHVPHNSTILWLSYRTILYNRRKASITDNYVHRTTTRAVRWIFVNERHKNYTRVH